MCRTSQEGGYLLHLALIEHHQLVRKDHCSCLVMGDIDGGGTQTALEIF
ncbi:MAG: hypothetical protein ACPG5T_09705 [Endozoicomonas sp.]